MKKNTLTKVNEIPYSIRHWKVVSKGLGKGGLKSKTTSTSHNSKNYNLHPPYKEILPINL